MGAASNDGRMHIGAGRGAGVFRPHGHIDVWREPPFVRLDAVGPFNVELLARYAADMDAVYRAAAADGPYVSLVRVTHSILMSPDALQALAASVKKVHAAGYGSVGVAYIVAADVEGRDVMLPRFEKKVYTPASTPMMLFDDEAPARTWALAHLTQARERAG